MTAKIFSNPYQQATGFSSWNFGPHHVFSRSDFKSGEQPVPFGRVLLKIESENEGVNIEKTNHVFEHSDDFSIISSYGSEKRSDNHR